jgi:hypothetical protein
MTDDFCDPHCPFLGCASCPYVGGADPNPDQEGDN